MIGDAVTLASAAPCTGELQHRLRVAVIVDCPAVAWQALTLARISASPLIELVALISAAPLEHARNGTERVFATLRQRLTSPLMSIVRALEHKIELEHDAFAQADLNFVSPQVARLELSGSKPSAAVLNGLKQLELDVLVDLSAGVERPALADAARHGLWGLYGSSCTLRRGAAAAFWPVYDGSPVTELEIRQFARDGGTRAINRSHLATNRYAVKLNEANLHWRAASLIPRVLERLQAGDSLAVSQADGSNALPRTSGPGPTHLAGHIACNIGRRAVASARRRFTNEQWVLLFHLGEDLCTDAGEFTEIMPPPDRYWADPHVVRHDGRFYIYAEEVKFAQGRGEIVVITLNPDGTHKAPVPVLQRDYHLSYPFVFEHEGTLFMVPESEENRTVDLYRCVEFPAKWEHVSTLLRGVAATDSTLVQHQGRWWMFTNLVDPPASYSEELYIYYAETLTGPWRPHRANPVVSDARRARPAGGLIRRGGVLFRPAQDCSVRYGYGIRLHEIKRLSETHYEEAEVTAIMPTWDRRIRATHTLGYTPGVTVLDALKPRLKSMLKQPTS